jgi:molybdate transport system ATP-binding protein
MIHLDFTYQNPSLSMQINVKTKSQIVCLHGHSGVGKTTILNIIAGIRELDYGFIDIAGRKLFDKNEGINIAPQFRDVGYIFQDLRLFSHLSVKDNITFGALKHNNYDSIIDLMDIDELLHKNISSLSGGESQKVSIARALVKNPKILLIDESFHAIDKQYRDQLIKKLHNHIIENQIVTILVSHQLSDAKRYSAEIIKIKKEKGIVVAG